MQNKFEALKSLYYSLQIDTAELVSWEVCEKSFKQGEKIPFDDGREINVLEVGTNSDGHDYITFHVFMPIGTEFKKHFNDFHKTFYPIKGIGINRFSGYDYSNCRVNRIPRSTIHDLYAKTDFEFIAHAINK